MTRVTLEGEHQYLLDLQQGYLSQANVTLRPVLDAPHQAPHLEIQFKEIKVVRPYRYQYEWKGLRIVTYDGPHEYLLVFKKRKHMQKALNTF